MVKRRTKPVIKKSDSTLPLLALICGLLGFIIPLGGIAAIILGVIALKDKTLPKSKKTMAWIGIILGIIKVLMVIVVITIMALAG